MARTSRLLLLRLLFFSSTLFASSLFIYTSLSNLQTDSPQSPSTTKSSSTTGTVTKFSHSWTLPKSVTESEYFSAQSKKANLVSPRLEHVARQTQAKLPNLPPPNIPHTNANALPPTPPLPPYSIPEVITFFESFLHTLHSSFLQHKQASIFEIWELYHSLAEQILYPWDQKYLTRMPIQRSDDSIFLSVASYRDENCLPTITNAYLNSANPSKLNVGLVQQNCGAGERCRSGILNAHGKMVDVEPDEDCALLFCQSDVGKDHCESGRFRALKVNETESLGPYAARFFASKLWDGEQWYMQIDSHMTFLKDWDEKSVSMLLKAPSKKPVLTHYPPAHTQKLGGVGSRICDPLFADSEIEEQIIRLMGSVNYDRSSTIPRFAPFVAAGYFVAHASFLQDVPFDPFLPWIFMGEEISMSARLWTAGYDIFSPSQSVTGHIYVRRHKPKFWETFSRVFRPGMHNPVQMVVLRRVKHMLDYPETRLDLIQPKSLVHHIDEYGLGTERKLEDYLEMAGLDMVSKKVKVATWCHDGVPPKGFEQYNHLYVK